VATSKFYFFDVGVANFLRGNRLLNRSTEEFGKTFEHFIAMELRAWTRSTGKPPTESESCTGGAS